MLWFGELMVGEVKWGCVCVWPPACVCSFFLWNQVKKRLLSLSVNYTIRLGSDCWYMTSSPSTPSQTPSSAPDLLPWTPHLHDDCKLLHLISYSKLLNLLGLYGLHYTYTCLHPSELRVFKLWWGCFPPSFWSSHRMRKTWLIHLAKILTWQIIRSEGPTLHNHHNKALPVTFVFTQTRTMCHV